MGKKSDNKDQNIIKNARAAERESKEKQLHEEYERARIKSEKENKLRESYAKKLYNDKIELIKQKQNQNDNAQLSPEISSNEKQKLSLGKKISDFIYHNKWWFGISAAGICIAGFLIYDLASRVEADMTIMYLSNNSDFYEYSDQLSEYLESYIGDVNGDGKIVVSIDYMPLGDDITTSQSILVNRNKLYAQMQNGIALLVIADKQTKDFIDPENNLMNLEETFPENEHIENYGFYLKDTDLCKKIGCANVPDDIYFGIRKVVSNTSYTKKMKKTFSNVFPAFENVINDNQ